MPLNLNKTIPMKLKLFFLLMFAIMIVGCGGAKKTVSDGPDASVNAKKLIALHEKAAFDFETLASRVAVYYQDGDKSQSITVSLRMQKDETIWVSATFLGATLAKILITPNRVQYYEVFNKTYFDGDFALLSNWLGIEVDFEIAQRLLLGQSVFPLHQNDFLATVMGDNYRLQPVNSNDFLKYMLLINPQNYNTASQQVIQPTERRMLKIDYPSFQTVNDKAFPKEIKINVSEAGSHTLINLDYRSVDYNPQVSFPFGIPGGYKEITIY